MKLEKFFLPLSILAAVIAVYIFFRGNGQVAATLPNPASAGVPGPYTLPGGGVTPVVYNVPAQQANPTAAMLLSQPSNPNPGSGPQNQTPPYLSFNLGPYLNLTQDIAPVSAATIPSSCGCGSAPEQNSACSACGTKNSYPDGTGSTPMSTSRRRQLLDSIPHLWLNDAIENLNTYGATVATAPEVPSLASSKESGSMYIN